MDEAVIKQKYRSQVDNLGNNAQKAARETARETAMALAVAKAMAVSRAVSPDNPGAWTIGADQMLVCGDRWFDKPIDLADARSHLQALRGQTHELISAVCIVRHNEIVWQYVDSAQLTMIPFSDDFLDKYLERSGPEVLESVGVYRLEGLGSQLFSAIDGDYFTVLGLPLLPLLSFLREAKVIDVSLLCD